MKKAIFIILSVIVIFGLIKISPVLFQEGNPIPIFAGVMKLSSSEDKIVQISDTPPKYISKTRTGKSPLIGLVEKEGWKFDEQLGAGFIFSKADNRLVVTSVQYTGNYTIWKLPE